MRFADDLEVARAVAMDSMFNTHEPCVQLLEEGSALCPVQHNHNDGKWKRGLRLQEIRYEGGLPRS